MMLFVFVISVTLLCYTFAGYPALMRLRAAARPNSKTSNTDHYPPLSIVIAAHNAEPLIKQRLENLLACDYPRDRLEIIVASDGSNDATAQTAARDGVRVLDFPERRGKPACLNDAIAQAKGEVLVLTDVRQHFEKDTLRKLVAPFADPEIGAVSGALTIAASDSAVGDGIGGYWKMERQLREDEATTGSAIGCTGAIYAIRCDCFRPIPADTLLDDVVIPMQIAESGARVSFEREARAQDPQPLDPQHEQRRKRRTIAGNFQMLFRYPQWCLPWGHPLWWRLISHKYLRLLAPVLLLSCLISNIWLAIQHPLFIVPLGAQAAFYALAAIGILWRGRLPHPLGLPAAFVFLNTMTLRGAAHYLTADQEPGW